MNPVRNLPKGNIQFLQKGETDMHRKISNWVKIEKTKLIKKELLSKGIFAFDLKSKKIARKAKPGQFIQIQVNNLFDPFLRRPFSFASVSSDTFRIVFRVRGKGTEILSQYRVGEYIDVLGPLGHPIKLCERKEVILIGGGVGIAPLYFLAQKLKMKNQLHIFLGAKSRDELIMLKNFKKLTKNIPVTTEDGSLGKRGKVTDLLIDAKFQIPDSKFQIFACGPLPMLSVIKNKFASIPVYGFLEERLGCGTGICFGCAVKRKSGGYLRVCQEGPVVNLNEVEI
jgi:dihydroorotate dehydrogenase electron transfer subunit